MNSRKASCGIHTKTRGKISRESQFPLYEKQLKSIESFCNY